jgi:LacI family transcriptional regulator
MTGPAWLLSERDDRPRRSPRAVAPRDALPTEVVPANVRDVARLARVSVGTVSNVLNRPDKVTRHTAGRVNDAIQKLGFVRNDVARQLRNGRSRSIGIVVLDVGDPFFSEVARGAEKSAKDRGFALLIGCSDDDCERESDYLHLFEEQRVRGVLIAPTGDAIARLEELRSRGIPAVLLGRAPEADTHDFSSVSVDDVEGGRLAVRHLAETGRRRIAFVGGASTSGQVQDRRLGARQETAKHPELSFESIATDSSTMAQGVSAAEEIAGRPAERRPDAVFAANDVIAVGLLQGLLKAHISVPEDIALIGYDDISFAESSVVPLSTISQPSELIGSAAVELLLKEDRGMAGHEQLVFQPRLVVRKSTSPSSAAG